MTSCCEMRASRALTWSSVRRWRSLPSRTGWPGIGIESCTPSASASGKILFSDSAAASAFGLPPSRQSSNWKRDCLTGFENATLPESTKVIFLQPQPWRILATAQPRVPAPRRRHLAPAISSVLRPGRALHFISFRFRSIADEALCLGSRVDAKLALLGPRPPLELCSQPTAFTVVSDPAGGMATSCQALRDALNLPSFS
mmetsp:Transcript_4443/g.13485  ORF Transcript_4443/g.13485 Transcript_4443/m.13485 type:complete len:200 (-) Transcript_4443:829-1428(-)